MGLLDSHEFKGPCPWASTSPTSYRSPPPPHQAIGYPRVPLSCCSYGFGRMGNMASVDQPRRSQVPLLQFWAQRYRTSSGIRQGMVCSGSSHNQGFPMSYSSPFQGRRSCGMGMSIGKGALGTTTSVASCPWTCWSTAEPLVACPDRGPIMHLACLGTLGCITGTRTRQVAGLRRPR